MERIHFEAQLVALEAEFASKKETVEDIIRERRMELEIQNKKHDEIVHDLKLDIVTEERRLAAIKREYICRKAEIHQEFAESHEKETKAVVDGREESREG